MSTIKVSTISPLGTDATKTITVGSAGDTIAGAGSMVPAFEASTGSQTVSDATVTKISLATETFDTDGCYDTSTYRFTPTIAGKYFVYTQAFFEESANFNRLFNTTIRIRKNGSDITNGILSFVSNNSSYSSAQSMNFNCIVSMNGSSDYVESFGYVDVSSGTPLIKNAIFGSYRIIGA